MPTPTPKSLGFHMPAEWTPHERTWMMWPARPEVWDDMGETCRNYAAVAHAIQDFEPLAMLVRPADKATARDLLGNDIRLLEHPIDDSWARDAGPCFVVNRKGERAAVSFEFNAWGEKYFPYDGDNAVSSAIAKATGVHEFTSRLIAEGGGVSVDGEGTILTTKSCFPNANRNPDWSLEEIETELKEMLGGEKVIWLPGNHLETETDGHVDGTAVFLAPGVVLVEAEGPETDEWHEINAANIGALEGQTDARGRALTLVRVPSASGHGSNHEKFCGSYVNAYLCNGAVIMPKYGLREDDLVREVFEEHLPGRAVVQVEIASIAIGGGGIHCITQQEPKA